MYCRSTQFLIGSCSVPEEEDYDYDDDDNVIVEDVEYVDDDDDNVIVEEVEYVDDDDGNDDDEEERRLRIHEHEVHEHEERGANVVSTKTEAHGQIFESSSCPCEGTPDLNVFPNTTFCACDCKSEEEQLLNNFT